MKIVLLAGRRLPGVILLGFSILLMSGGCSQMKSPGDSAVKTIQGSNAAPKFDTEYQAVLLSNGQVFFGKLENFGSPQPILREVYYVRTTPASKEGAQPTSVLVKRGQEWHSPSYMVLNAEHIILVETVGNDSKVAKLIAEQKKK